MHTRLDLRLPGRPKHRWKDNINIDVKEIECESVDWIHLVRERASQTSLRHSAFWISND